MGNPNGNPASLKHGPGRGRPKGVVNKSTIGAKAAIEAVFDKIGGTARFAKWAEEEPTEFFKIYSKLVPRDLTVSGGDTPIRIAITERLEKALARIKPSG